MNAIVVGQRGAIRDGLIALLYTVPQIRVVSATEHYESARQLVEEHSSTLVVLQVDSLDHSCADWIRMIKDRSPHTKILALVSETYLRSQCVAAGVDLVLVQGTSIESLYGAVNTLATTS